MVEFSRAVFTNSHKKLYTANQPNHSFTGVTVTCFPIFNQTFTLFCATTMRHVIFTRVEERAPSASFKFRDSIVASEKRAAVEWIRYWNVACIAKLAETGPSSHVGLFILSYVSSRSVGAVHVSRPIAISNV